MRIVKTTLAGTATFALMVIGPAFLSGSAYASTGSPAHASAVAVQARTATSNPNAEDWEYAGKYYSLEDCKESGQEGMDNGADQYRCDEVIEPDGSIAYYNLYLLYYD
jgi:hypothetical protein